MPTKATTTVAMDFGRLTLAEDLVLYLFGTPGQRRFWFMWDDLCLGAIGAIVLVDTARLDESFSPLDYFESKGLPFIVAVNQFDGVQHYTLEEVADALALPADVPIISVDARDRESAKAALIRVTEYALQRLTESTHCEGRTDMLHASRQPAAAPRAGRAPRSACALSCSSVALVACGSEDDTVDAAPHRSTRSSSRTAP